MTSRKVTNAVCSHLSDAVRLSAEAVQTGSSEFVRLARRSIQHTKNESEGMLTPGEREFINDLTAFIDRYLEMKFPKV